MSATLKRKFQKIIILLLILSGISCSQDNDVDVIEKEKFVDILTDMHLTDAILANKGWYDAKLKDTTRSYYNYILKKYDISRAEFDYSLDYYSHNIEEYNIMYDEVIAKLNEKLPRQLHEHSIYKIFENVLKDAEIKNDLNNYYGINGKELWRGRRGFTLPKDTLNVYTDFLDSINYQGLAVFKTEIMVLPKDSSQKLSMKLIINYKDSTFEKVEKAITAKDGKWQNYKLILRTDSLKKPRSLKAYLSNRYNNKDSFRLELKNMSLKQYAPDKDTSLIDSIIPNQKKMERSEKLPGKLPSIKSPD
ncbi:MAG: DUF4296 domain-containing protein [Bacteroidales bacterium]|nr:DUF4296 domain-containing protein [Bacteroidales bacterium]